jgi:hypothetical protein
MTRLARHLFSLAAAMSLAVCLATLAFWASGRVWSPSPVWGEQQTLTRTWHAVTLGQGALQFETLTPPTDPAPNSTDTLYGFGRMRHQAYAVSQTGGPNILLGDIESVLVPFWFIALATAVLPAAWVAPHVRARLFVPPGHCRHCGYDLRASPERCPECGAPAGLARVPD